MGGRQCFVDWDAVAPIMGVWTDSSIARVYDVTPQAVRFQRLKRGIGAAGDIHKERVANKSDAAKALRQAVLDAMFTRAWTRPEEIMRRVSDNYTKVSRSTISHILLELVRMDLVSRIIDGPQTTYRKKVERMPPGYRYTRSKT